MFVAIPTGSFSLSSSWPNDHSTEKCFRPCFVSASTTLPSRSGSTPSFPVSTKGNVHRFRIPSTCMTSWITRFTWQTEKIICLRFSLLNRALNRTPLSNSTLKCSLTAGTWCNSSRQTLQAANASVGLSTTSSIVAINRYCIANRRSGKSKASSLKAFIASRRASLNFSNALLSFFVADSSNAVSSNLLLISSVSSILVSAVACVCEVIARCTLLDLVLSNTSYNSSIPSFKRLILANKFFLASPSNFDLSSSISRTTRPWNFWSVTSLSFNFSASLSLPLFTSRPIVALNTAVIGEEYVAAECFGWRPKPALIPVPDLAVRILLKPDREARRTPDG